MEKQHQASPQYTLGTVGLGRGLGLLPPTLSPSLKSPPFPFPMPTVTAASPGHSMKIGPWAQSLQDPQPWLQAWRSASPSELGVVTSPSEAGLCPSTGRGRT